LIARRILGLLDQVDTEQRRIWAARILLWSLAGWIVSHILLLILPLWFFQHVLLAISWLAISITAVDVIVTSDVRDQQDGN
jgi:hypothetical protein